MEYKKSYALYERAQKSIAGGHLSNFKQKAGNPQTFFERVEGSKLYDVDGNEYIDFSLASGPCILGQSNPALQNAIIEQMKKCYSRTFSLIQVEAAELFCEYVNSADRMRFSTSGGEGILYALRTARAYTGKNMVVRFMGQYFGGTDIVLGGIPKDQNSCRAQDNYDQNDVYSQACYTSGRAKHALDDCYLLEFNDLPALEKLFQEDDDIACVIMEPVALNISGCVGEPGFYQGVRELCTKYGVVLIFDETLTGFRIDLRSAQGYFGVTPDMSTFAKAIGGGFPVSAFGGKKEIMDVLAECKAIIPGTYNGNCLSAAAMKATITELAKNDGEIYPQLFALGDLFKEGVLEAAKRHGVPMIMQGFPAALFPVFTEKERIRNHREAILYSDLPRMYRFGSLMKQHGVIGDDRYCISAAHTESDIYRAIEAANKSLKIIAEEM